MTRCFIGLGANLGTPLQALCNAAEQLDAPNLGRVTARSSIYRSAPLGPPGQDDYLNAVVAVETTLEPHALLDQLQAIENRAGRRREQRWGPRTLDLDLLLYGDLSVQDPRLTLPHPRILERNFVLLPLAELLGNDWQFADGNSIGDRLAACPDNPISRTAFSWRAQETARSAQRA